MLVEGKSAEEISAIMTQRAEKQKEQEIAIKKAQEEERKKQMLEEKIREGEKLVMAGIITAEEFAAIKEKYQQDLAVEEKEETEPKLNSGLSLTDEEEEVAAEDNTDSQAPETTEETKDNKEGDEE